MTRDDKGRFPKGISGNPKGRKPRQIEKDYLALFRSSVSPEDWVDIVLRAVDDAKEGDGVARKFIADYLIGAPVQKIAPTTPDGENPYMGAEVGDLIDLANKISGATK
jgi:hypothetical protein